MKKIMLFAAACAALAACSKERMEENGAVSFKRGEIVTLTVSVPQDTDTKVTSSLDSSTGAVSFRWESGDAIRITVGNATAKFTVSKLIDGGKSAEFTGTMPAAGDKFDVRYPYDGVEESALAVQTYSSSEVVPRDKMLAAATDCTVGEPFDLKPQYAVLRLNLWGGYEIRKIVVMNSSTGITGPVYTLDCGTGVVIGTSAEAATPFFIVVPAGEAGRNFSVEIFGISESPLCSFKKRSTDKCFVAGKVLNMPAREVIQEGILPGMFTIDESGTQVCFSKGNLYYNGADDSHKMNQNLPSGWNFYSKQYEKSDAVSENDEISLFTWGYGEWSTVWDTEEYAPAVDTTGKNYAFVDWGPAVMSDFWHTLSDEEWNYIRNNYPEHTAANVAVAVAAGDTVRCDMLAPKVCLSGYVFDKTKKLYTADEWAEADARGVVCFSYECSRIGKTHRGRSVAGCWTSSRYFYAIGPGAYRVDSFKPGYADMKIGYSVRLAIVVR